LKIYVDADACQVVRIVEIDEDLDCIFYDIDCGCAMRKKRPNGKLACIRLAVIQRRGWIEDMCRNMSRKAEEGLWNKNLF
jgi:hypothetical protein